MNIGAIEPGAPRPAELPPAPRESSHAPAREGPSSFSHVLHGLGHAIGEGEGLLQRAMAAPRDTGPAELMALQAGVYRYSEVIDLASRLVDHATSDIKTVLQGAGQ